MKFAQDNIVAAGDMSADVESSPILLDQIYGFAMQAVYTGAPDGVLKIQVSCDITSFADKVVNWDDLASSSVIISAAGITTYNVDAQFYKWVKIVYTFSAGTGVLNVAYNSKG
jgi:hypothetical protein